MTTATLSTETISETIRSAFDFSVDKMPLSGPDNMKTPHYGLFRSDNMASVGKAVSRTYNPHTVDDICALAEAASEAFDGASSVQAHWRDGHYITVAPSNDQQRAVFDKRFVGAGAHEIRDDSDIYIPRLIIRAGYDGRAFTAQLGIYRLVCRNLAVIPVKGKSVSASIRHTSNLQNRVESLAEDFRSILANADDVAEAIDQANRQKVDMAAFIRKVYPLRDDASQRVQNAYAARVEAIMSRLYRERNALGLPSEDYGTATAWEAYNAVQGHVQHEARRNKRPSQFDRALMALEDPAVARAAELAFTA